MLRVQNLETTPSSKVHSGLNPVQIQAVEHRDGALAVYAGAGSGKTRVIVHRILKMIESGIPSSAILAVTFTNKAAREMKERLIVLSDSAWAARNVMVSTFHAAAARFLRIYASELGFTQNFTIADDSDQKSILKQVCKEMQLAESAASPQVLKGKIDRLKNAGYTPQTYLDYLKSLDGSSDKETRRSFRSYGEEIDNRLVARVFAAYQAELKRADAMDFNDLLVNMVMLLRTSARAREQLQFRFRYFLIDEFQDTNPVQFEWLQIMSAHTGNLCIVGDDDQSIYSWRGAEPKFIVDFKKYYPNAAIIKLEQNYRSTAKIIQAASAVIANNQVRAQKTLYTTNPPGEKICIMTRSDNASEGLWIASEIAKKTSQGAAYGDFAILYRTNAQSRILEDELRRKLLPYVIYGSVRFYERAEIKILMNYLRLLVNFKDDLAFEKCIAVPKRGFGDKALTELREVARANNLCLTQAAARIAYGELPSPFARGLGGLKKFVELYTSLKIKLDEGESPVQVLEKLISTIDFEDYLRTNYPEDFDEKWLNVIELQNALSDFLEQHAATKDADNSSSLFDERPQNNHPLADFLETAALITEPEKKNVERGSEDAITLMTIHSSKGLEFRNVYICGLEEGVLPHMNSMETQSEIEEERRLLYVAMTRARERLAITLVKRHRFRRDMPTQPSRFLDEIPYELCDQVSEEDRYHGSFRNRTGAVQAEKERQRAEPAFKRLQDLLRTGDQLASRNATPLHSSSSGTLPVGHDSGQYPNETCQFVVGQLVKHKVFGTGVVRNIEAAIGNFRLEIKFPQVGLKRLVHTYVTPIEND